MEAPIMQICAAELFKQPLHKCSFRIICKVSIKVPTLDIHLYITHKEAFHTKALACIYLIFISVRVNVEFVYFACFYFIFPQVYVNKNITNLEMSIATKYCSLIEAFKTGKVRGRQKVWLIIIFKHCISY